MSETNAPIGLEQLVEQLCDQKFCGIISIKFESGSIRHAKKISGNAEAVLSATSVVMAVRTLRSKKFFGDVTINFNSGAAQIGEVAESIRVR